jgi:hypothetical protein
MSSFRLRFSTTRIEHWASRFSDPDDDSLRLEVARARAAGYLRKADLVRLARWKTPRSQRRVAENPERFVREVTRAALSTPDERLRIEVLTLLSGVDWPTASVILHFCHRDPYPVLDIRALWSLGLEKAPNYDFEFWWGYTQACRRIAARAGCSMRAVDRALWQYSKERQGRKPRGKDQRVGGTLALHPRRTRISSGRG